MIKAFALTVAMLFADGHSEVKITWHDDVEACTTAASDEMVKMQANDAVKQGFAVCTQKLSIADK